MAIVLAPTKYLRQADTNLPRTLQRHLQHAGTHYQEVLDQLHQKLAEHCRLRSDLAIEDIAGYLSFSEARSLHRSFQA